MHLEKLRKIVRSFIMDISLVWDFNQLYINLTGEVGVCTRSTKQDMPWVRRCRLMLLATVRKQITYISMTLTSSSCMVSRNHILLPLCYSLNWCLLFITYYIRDICMSLHHNIITDYSQQDAMVLEFIYFYRCCTCFRWFLRPSSGAHNCTYDLSIVNQYCC
jgi:hypothetical protein